MTNAPDRPSSTNRTLISVGILLVGALIILALNGWNLTAAFPWMLIAIFAAAGFYAMSGRSAHRTGDGG